MTKQTRQQGASAIAFIIILAVLAYGVFVGIQYVPQYIESNTVKTVLETIVEKNKKEPYGDINAVKSAIDKLLYINEKSDLEDSFKVKQYRGDITIMVSYERELNLLYKTEVITYEKSVALE